MIRINVVHHGRNYVLNDLHQSCIEIPVCVPSCFIDMPHVKVNMHILCQIGKQELCKYVSEAGLSRALVCVCLHAGCCCCGRCENLCIWEEMLLSLYVVFHGTALIVLCNPSCSN